jgi:hypothetical protein
MSEGFSIDDCEVFSRYPGGVSWAQVSDSDKELFKDIRTRLKNIAEEVAGSGIGKTSLSAAASLYTPNGRSPKEIWSCVYPALVRNKSYGLQVAIIVSDRGAELCFCMGAGASQVSDTETRRELETSLDTVRSRLQALPPGIVSQVEEGLSEEWFYRRSWLDNQRYSEFNSLGEWILYASSGDGNGASVSKYLSPSELEVQSGNIGELCKATLRIFSPILDAAYSEFSIPGIRRSELVKGSNEPFRISEQVMIYEVKSTAHSNALKLFSPDRKFFYWNDRAFKKLNEGDYVIVVDRHEPSPFVLFTQLDLIDIATHQTGGHTEFTDLNINYPVSGAFDGFVRLKVLQEISPSSWEWKNLGSTEMVYLNGPNVNQTYSSNRKLNIKQLKTLSADPQYQQILDASLRNFGDANVVNEGVENGKKDQIHQEPPRTMLNYNHPLRRQLVALRTKPFMLLAGLSGTGKSRLVRTLAYQTCWHPDLTKDHSRPGNFELIPVRPNWHDSADLMGFVSRINEEKYVTTSFLKFVAKAWRYPRVPFFLCLDEMNLAPVEQYFAEYLSILETRESRDGEVHFDCILSRRDFENSRLYEQVLEDLVLNDDPRFLEGIPIPPNLIVIGTVNMDETTHSFSRKVLDRAMTFEMNEVDLMAGLDPDQSDWKYPESFISVDNVIGTLCSGAEVFHRFDEATQIIGYLTQLNTALDGSPFKIAYRVRDEFLVYCYYSSLLENKPANWLESALDELTAMKVLSRVEGDETKTSEIISKLLGILDEYPISRSKLSEMKSRLQSGYTSFWA